MKLILILLLCFFAQTIAGFWSNLYAKFIENQLHHHQPHCSSTSPQSQSLSMCSSSDLQMLISTAHKSAFEMRLVWLPFMMLERWKCEKGLSGDSGVVNAIVKMQFWISLLDTFYRECRCLGVAKRQCLLDRNIFLRHRWAFRERAAHLLNQLAQRHKNAQLEEDKFLEILKDSIVLNIGTHEFNIRQMNAILRGKVGIPDFAEEDFGVNSIAKLVKRLEAWDWKEGETDWQPSSIVIGFSKTNAFGFLFRWEALSERLELAQIIIQFDELGRLECDFCNTFDQRNWNREVCGAMGGGNAMKRSDSSTFALKIGNWMGRMRKFVHRSVSTFSLGNPTASSSSIFHHPNEAAVQLSRNLYWSSISCPLRHLYHLRCTCEASSFSLARNGESCRNCEKAIKQVVSRGQISSLLKQFQYYIENSLFKLRFEKETLTRSFDKISLLNEMMEKLRDWNRQVVQTFEDCEHIFAAEDHFGCGKRHSSQSVLRELFRERIFLTAGQQAFFTLKNAISLTKSKMHEIFHFHLPRNGSDSKLRRSFILKKQEGNDVHVKEKFDLKDHKVMNQMKNSNSFSDECAKSSKKNLEPNRTQSLKYNGCDVGNKITTRENDYDQTRRPNNAHGKDTLNESDDECTIKGDDSNTGMSKVLQQQHSSHHHHLCEKNKNNSHFPAADNSYASNSLDIIENLSSCHLEDDNQETFQSTRNTFKCQNRTLSLEDLIDPLNEMWVKLYNLPLKLHLFEDFCGFLQELPAFFSPIHHNHNHHQHHQEREGEEKISRFVCLWSFWYAINQCKFRRFYKVYNSGQTWAFKANFTKACSLFQAIGELIFGHSSVSCYCCSTTTKTTTKFKRNHLKISQNAIAWKLITYNQPHLWLTRLIEEFENEGVFQELREIDLLDPQAEDLNIISDCFGRISLFPSCITSKSIESTED